MPVSRLPLDHRVAWESFSQAEKLLFKRFLAMDLDAISTLILSGPSEEDREAWGFFNEQFLNLARRARRHLTGAQNVGGLKDTLQSPHSANPLRDILQGQLSVLQEHLENSRQINAALKSIAKEIEEKIALI